jgi:GTP-binding protein
MRAPRFAQPGEPGEIRQLRLELKILADAGLIGLPNAGKSTFISRVSAARPKIAAYPFTTLTPNLGVMIDDADPGKRLVLADIPGLIEGAHQGQGLGLRFLKHVERTRFLVHILSAEDVNDADPWAGFGLINEELRRFDPDLAQRRQVEVVNKIDLLPPERLAALEARAKADGRQIFFISARDGLGLEPLTAELWRLRDAAEPHAPLVRAQEPVQVEDEEFPEIEVIYTRE